MGSSEAEAEVEEEAGVGSMGEEVGEIGTIIIMEIGTIIMEVEEDGETVKIMVEEVGAIGIVITIITTEAGAIETITTTGTTGTTTTTTTVVLAALLPTNPTSVQTVSTNREAAVPTVQYLPVGHLLALYNSTNPRKRHNSSV